MVMVVENSPGLSSSTSGPMTHYCRVCNRGFNCAGALGGHMRSHTVGDQADKSQSDDHDHMNNKQSNVEGQKHSYFLRTIANRFVTKSRGYRADDDDKGVMPHGSIAPFSSSPPLLSHQYCVSKEDMDLANCLVMLSSNGSFQFTSSQDDIHDHKGKMVKEEDTNNNNNRGLFPCKACNKVFNSHQALGGHRASHKKVKGCYAAKLDNLNNDNNNNKNDDTGNYCPDEFLDSDYSLPSPPPPSASATISRKRSGVHECSICHRIFSSGQALGGHKRCHWLAASNTADTTVLQSFQAIAAYDNKQSPPLIFKNPSFSSGYTSHGPSSSLDLNIAPTITNVPRKSSFEKETATRSGYLDLWEKGVSTNTANPSQNQCGEEKSPKLKDMKLDGGSSASGWLQMGIASFSPSALI
ncbi:unnamed protein product [Cuscuta epithymum]|uniref:C2H2-type domain-containing protein n=1 Tax=Cuscuta epithymum TaxID=186058 RepID=A0AAV0G915_9ASTE|nr:unnamed protein product [Cuscuta epithymum]